MKRINYKLFFFFIKQEKSQTTQKQSGWGMGMGTTGLGIVNAEENFWKSETWKKEEKKNRTTRLRRCDSMTAPVGTTQGKIRYIRGVERDGRCNGHTSMTNAFNHGRAVGGRKSTEMADRRAAVGSIGQEHCVGGRTRKRSRSRGV